MEIAAYEEIIKNDKICLKLKDDFFANLKLILYQKYGSLIAYNNKQLHESHQYARQIFLKNRYIHPRHVLQIIKDSDISKKELFANITGFRIKGSRREGVTKLTEVIEIDEFFAEGFALYLAEGDNGSNGTTTPNRVSLVNSDLNVIKHFAGWISKYFPRNEYYFVYLLPTRLQRDEQHIDNVKNLLGIDRIKVAAWNAKRKSNVCYRVCLTHAVIIYLILQIKETLKRIVSQNTKLMKAYIRGMMIGEGTVYHKENRHYVRIEMKNKDEVIFVANLLRKLEYKVTCKERGTRKGMWYVYFGGKRNLFKFYEEIGFGILEKRQSILREIIRWYAEHDTAAKNWQGNL